MKLLDRFRLVVDRLDEITIPWQDVLIYALLLFILWKVW